MIIIHASHHCNSSSILGSYVGCDWLISIWLPGFFRGFSGFPPCAKINFPAKICVVERIRSRAEIDFRFCDFVYIRVCTLGATQPFWCHLMFFLSVKIKKILPIYRNLKTESAHIRFNLAFSIGVAQILFLSGVEATNNQVGCFLVFFAFAF